MIDAPASSSLITENLVKYAWGFERLVFNYTGNTVRLKRLSDNVQENFGFDSITGIFNLTAVDSWRAGADVDIVYFIDQMGSAAQLTNVSTVAFIRSNVVGRFGTTWNSSDDMLTRSTTDGGVGADLGDAVGALDVVVPTLATAAGFESHLLVSSNERKRPTNLTDPLGIGNNISEIYFAVGHTTSLRYFHQVSGGNQLNLTRVQTTATDQDATTTSTGNFQKQYSQHVYSYKLEPDRFSIYTYGKRYMTDSLLANNVTNIANNVFDNPKFIVGGNFGSTANNSVSATLRANILFGGLIVTSPLTAIQRYLLQSKLSAVGQQHRIKSIADILPYFQELVVLKDVNASTGLVAGRNGLLSLQFNTSTVAEGTPNFNFSYAHPDVGLRGIYAPDDDNNANGFKATTTYFAGNIKGTVLSLHYLDPVSAGVTAAELSATFIQGTGNQFGVQNPDWSLSLQFDHNAPTLTGMAAGSKDDSGLMGTRRKADEAQFGSLIYDMANQAMGKYNRNTAHVPFVYGETFSSHTWDEADWANVGDAPYTLDAPVVRPIPSNVQYPWRHDTLMLQIGTFEAPVEYDRSASYATRKALRLNSVNKSYVSVGSTPIGHDDGAIAINNRGGVVDSDDDAYIMSHHFQQVFQGTRFLFGFSPNVFTLAQIEEVQVNLYKLFDFHCAIQVTPTTSISIGKFIEKNTIIQAIITPTIQKSIEKYFPAIQSVITTTIEKLVQKNINITKSFTTTLEKIIEKRISIQPTLTFTIQKFIEKSILVQPVITTVIQKFIQKSISVQSTIDTIIQKLVRKNISVQSTISLIITAIFYIVPVPIKKIFARLKIKEIKHTFNKY